MHVAHHYIRLSSSRSEGNSFSAEDSDFANSGRSETLPALWQSDKCKGMKAKI
jgi:hypothetical protein